MHIPASDTSETDVAPFPAALADEERRTRDWRAAQGVLRLADGPDADDYDRDRWLYVPDRYGEYRYLLGTRGERPLVCVGVNPSTAAPGDLDPTLKSVARIAAANGYDSWMMFNVYAQRATRPDDLDAACNRVLHRENLAAFRWLLAHAGPAPAVWAAWGAVIEKRPYLADCVADLVAAGRAFGARWLRAGRLSKAGHPHHPLYLRKDEPLVPFDPA